MRGIVLFLLFLAQVQALVQYWDFEEEDRDAFFIERFGFQDGGQLDLGVRGVKYVMNGQEKTVTAGTQANAVRAGIIGAQGGDMFEVMDRLHDLKRQETCLLDDDALQELPNARIYINLMDPATWQLNETIAKDKTAYAPGFYYFLYAQCSHEPTRLSFEMAAKFQNGATNFLSTGDAALPTVYLVASLSFLLAAIAWGVHLHKQSIHVQGMHHLMTALVVLKSANLLAKALRLQYMKTYGDDLTSWSVVLYVLTAIKGALLFTVLLLLGSGWSHLRPHLSVRDTRILSVVLLFQTFSGIFRATIDDTDDVGTEASMRWHLLLHVLDLACCVLVFLPLLDSIHRMRLAAATDGKTHVNLQKLRQFRNYYGLLLLYVYTTRLAVYFVDSQLSFMWTWVAPAVTEGATLAFYLLTAYQFRPRDQNPYLSVPTRVDDLNEFDMDDDVVQQEASDLEFGDGRRRQIERE